MLVYLLCLVALAASASGTGYQENREYLYKYYGHVHAGFPGLKSQYSVIAFSSDVIVHPHSDHWIIKLDNPKFDKVNDIIDDVDEYEYNFKPISAASEHISKPFKVTFDRGQLKNFQVNKDEPEWSINVKKGVLSFFNLNLNQDKTLRMRDEKSRDKLHSNANYYKVMEDGITGECETEYVITSEPFELTPYMDNVLNVTKSRNYHNCVSRPSWEYETISGDDCDECDDEDEDEDDFLHGNAYYHYDILGDRRNFVIEYAYTIGDVVFNPYGDDGQNAVIQTNRTLDLQEERERKREMNLETSDLTTRYSLTYHLPGKKDYKKPVDLKEPHYLHDIYGFKASISEIGKLFEELVEVYDEDESYITKMKSENVPGKFLELVRAVSTLGFEGIKQLYKDHADVPLRDITNEQKQKRQLFVDMLAATGTNPAFLMSKKLIQDKSIPKEQIKYLIQRLPYHIKEVTETLLDEFYQMCEHSNVRESYKLHTTCYLAFSTLVNDACVDDYDEDEPEKVDKSQCTPEDAVKYFNYIATQNQHNTNDKHTIAYIRAIANFGIKEVVHHLKPYLINEDDYPVYHRVSAIWALSNVVDNYPEEVMPWLVPIFYNSSEDHEIRIAAFSLMMSADPSMYQLETIARSLDDEDDIQVAAYVYSTFYYLANSTHPCHEKISNKINDIFYIIEEYQDDWEDMDMSVSTNYYSTGYVDEFDYGGYTQLSYIASNTSYIPRAAYLKVNDYLWGESIDTLAIGYHAQGLEKFFDKIFGPEGLYREKSLFDLLKRRSPRDINNVEQEIQEIDRKLNIETREYDDIEGDIFVEYMGNNIAMFQFDEQTFDLFFRDEEIRVPDIPSKWNELTKFIHERFMLPVDRLYVVPNEVGMPIVLDYKIPVFWHYKNNDINLDVKPNLFKENRNKEPSEIELQIDGHWIMDKEHYLTLGVIIPAEHITSGVGVHRRSILSLPIDAEISVDLMNPKVNLKWNPIVEHQIFHQHSEPFTYINKYTDVTPIVQEDTYLPLYKEESLDDYEEEYLHDHLGLGLQVKGDYQDIWNDKGSWWEFLTENDPRDIYYYLLTNPQMHAYHVDVALTQAEKDITNEIEFEWSYEYHRLHHYEPHVSEFLPDEVLDEDVKPKRDLKFRSHVLRTEITGKGQRERKVQGEIAYSHTPNMLYHKLNVFFERTPLHRQERDNFKVCMLGALKFPRHDYEKLYNLETMELDLTVNSTLKINFGTECRGEHKITIRGHHERSDEQEELDSQRDEPVDLDDYNLYADLYQDCIEDRKEGLYYTDNCLDYLKEVTQMLDYTWDIEYENIPVELKNLTYKASEMLKYYLYPHMENNAFSGHNPDHRIRIEANFSVDDPIMDLRVYKPYETTYYTNVFIPDEAWTPYSTYPLLDYTNLEELINGDSYPSCMVEKNVVSTFDDVTYELPPNHCYKVISKDCSPNEHFVVLGRNISHPEYNKVVKVLLGKWKIEIEPMRSEDDLTVKINGRQVPVTEDQRYVETDEEGKDSEVAFYVRYNGLYYTIHSDRYGLIVQYDGRAIYVKVSSYYRGKVCGLCGDFNGQMTDDFRGPEDCVYYNATKFAYSYAIEEPGCHVPKFESPCDTQHGQKCTVLRNRLVHTVQNRVPQTCFSTIPLPKCAQGCQETKKVTKKVPFHCLPASDTFTNYLKKESARRVLDEVTRKNIDHYSEIEYPEKCERHEPRY